MVVKIEEDFLTLQRELVSQLPRIEANIADLDEKGYQKFLTNLEKQMKEWSHLKMKGAIC